MVIRDHCYADLQWKKANRAKINTNVQFEEKNSTRNLVLEPWLVLKEIKRKGIKGVVPSGQNPTQLILQIVRRKKIKVLRNDLSLKSNNKFIPIQFKKVPGSRFHPKQAPELDNFGHVFWP